MAIPLHALKLGLSLLQPRRRERPGAVSPARRTCILIVVEDRLAGKHLSRLLKAKGYERVRVVRRAASALLLAQQSSPSIVFLDVALSDGVYELAGTLRRQAGKGALRLIALTASIEHSTREEARGAGFERWLITPVAKDELDSLMRSEDAATA